MYNKKIFKCLASIYTIFRKSALFCLVTAILLLFLESIIRKILGKSIINVDEIGGLGMYLFVVLNIGWLYREGLHLNSDFVISGFSLKARSIIEIILDVFTFMFAIFAIYLWWKYLFLSTFGSKRFFRLTGWVEWPFHLVGVLSWLMLAVAAIERFFMAIRQFSDNLNLLNDK